MNNVLLPMRVSIFLAQSSMKTFSSWSEKKKQAYDTNVDIKSVLKLINKHLLDPTFVQMTTLENEGKAILLVKGGCKVLRSETCYILKAFSTTIILDKDYVNTKKKVDDPGLKSAHLTETTLHPAFLGQRQHLKVKQGL